ncbi:MAG: alpha/beta fold hydrolase [Acidimicrobiales bacterium]
MHAIIDEGGGRSVLLIHGQPGLGADWCQLAGLLARDHRVVAPDRPGWGGDETEATGLRGNAAALAGVVETCALPPPLTVVGHSLGGGIAIALALERPDLVGSLVLVGSVGVDQAINRFDRLLAVPAVGGPAIRVGLAMIRSGVSAATRLTRSGGGAPLSRRIGRLAMVRSLLWVAAQPIGARARSSFLIEQRALLEETPTIELALGHLDVPVAVVHGTADRIVSPAAARLLAGRIPGAELVWLKGQGHLVPFERPELVVPIIRRYSAIGDR